MKIRRIQTFQVDLPLVEGSYRWSGGKSVDVFDSTVVRIETDEGITGIGESDVNPWIARACIEAPSTHTMGLGLKDMLIGENPLDTERLWEKLYVGSCMNGRRGAVINAMGAIDMALWDIKAKPLGSPSMNCSAGCAESAWCVIPTWAEPIPMP